MSRLLRSLSLAVVAASVLTLQPAFSQQQPPTTRIRGTIEALDDSSMTIKNRVGGASVKIALPAATRVTVSNKASLADIKPNSFIGVAGESQDDGSQKAVSIVIFPEDARGRGEGFREWDLGPKSTMTNATVAPDSVKSNDGQVLTLKYKDGEKKVIITDKTIVASPTPGTKADLKVGAAVIVTATKKDDAFEAVFMSVGKDGFVPL